MRGERSVSRGRALWRTSSIAGEALQHADSCLKEYRGDSTPLVARSRGQAFPDDCMDLPNPVADHVHTKEDTSGKTWKAGTCPRPLPVIGDVPVGRVTLDCWLFRRCHQSSNPRWDI